MPQIKHLLWVQKNYFEVKLDLGLQLERFEMRHFIKKIKKNIQKRSQPLSCLWFLNVSKYRERFWPYIRIPTYGNFKS